MACLSCLLSISPTQRRKCLSQTCTRIGEFGGKSNRLLERKRQRAVNLNDMNDVVPLYKLHMWTLTLRDHPVKCDGGIWWRRGPGVVVGIGLCGGL